MLQLALIVIYGAGVWVFWRGFERTHFEQNMGNRLKLSLLWPILIIASQSYRQNFNRALKGK